jgi:hypothetical protein
MLPPGSKPKVPKKRSAPRRVASPVTKVKKTAASSPKFFPIPLEPAVATTPTVVGHVPNGASILIVKEPWLGLILDGQKSDEIRGQTTLKENQRIYLARSGGGGMVIGSALLVRCHGPLSRADWEERRSNHFVAGAALPYGASTYAWELSAAMRFDAPVSYLHKRGCVVWAKK